MDPALADCLRCQAHGWIAAVLWSGATPVRPKLGRPRQVGYWDRSRQHPIPHRRWTACAGHAHQHWSCNYPSCRYLILAKHSFRRSSSVRICVSMASCSAAEPLLDNSAEAFLSRFCLQSRIACLVAIWACDVVLRYVLMQASAIEQVWHS
jgi:hypothetical protein